MDRLSSCYFCGAALDDQLSEYPVVPRRLQSGETEGKTVVLCQGCRRKLGNILEPVVAAVESDATASADAADYEGTEFESLDARSNGETADQGSLLGESDGVESTSAVDTPASEPPQSDDSDETDAEPARAAGSEDGGDDGDSDDGPSLTKLEYNKVMRLLQNREFPVDRMEIREVATSAYQIDPEEFDRVIEAAIDRGLIAEEGGQFVSPDGR